MCSFSRRHLRRRDDEERSATLTIRLIGTAATSRYLVDHAPKGYPNKGDVVRETSTLRNAVAQFARPKGAIVGRDVWITTIVIPPFGKADVKAATTLPGGTIRAVGTVTATQDHGHVSRGRWNSDVRTRSWHSRTAQPQREREPRCDRVPLATPLGRGSNRCGSTECRETPRTTECRRTPLRSRRPRLRYAAATSGLRRRTLAGSRYGARRTRPASAG